MPAHALVAARAWSPGKATQLPSSSKPMSRGIGPSLSQRNKARPAAPCRLAQPCQRSRLADLTSLSITLPALQRPLPGGSRTSCPTDRVDEVSEAAAPHLTGRIPEGRFQREPQPARNARGHGRQHGSEEDGARGAVPQLSGAVNAVAAGVALGHQRWKPQDIASASRGLSWPPLLPAPSWPSSPNP